MWLYAGTPLEPSVLVIDQDHSNNLKDWAIRREDRRFAPEPSETGCHTPTPRKGPRMKIQSKLKQENILQTAWKKLFEEKKIFFAPTECGNDCLAYARLQHRDVFFTEVQPEGTWHCSECGAERRKNEVVVDHIDHIHNGFGYHNCPENLRALCGKCNVRLGRKTPRDLLPELYKNRWAERTREATTSWWASRSVEELAEISKSFKGAQDERYKKTTPEQRRAQTRKGQEKHLELLKTDSEYAEAVSSKQKEVWEKMTPEEREERIRRMKAGHHGRLHVAKGFTDPNCEFCSRGSGN
jgi:hypothetical protein